MKSSPKFICGILLGVAAFTLTGCAVRTIPLNEGAENIKVVDASAPRYSHLTLVPVNCQYKGKILSQYELSYAPQDTRPTQNEITVMKNKALVLGANLVMINHNEIIMQGHQYEHVMLSRAYECGTASTSPAVSYPAAAVPVDDSQQN
jgi:hypothetical protein